MESFPKDFYCALSKVVMKDPVKAPDNNTYERSAITEYLRINHRSPITREKMEIYELVPNVELKKKMEDNYKGLKKQGSEVGEIELLINKSAEIQGSNAYYHLSVVPPKEGVRSSSIFVCVVDVSGSMNEPDPAESELEDSGFSRLDIVKHSIKTIINILNDEDYLGLVTFHTNANVVMKIRKMDEAGKQEANTKVDSMQPEDNTNIYEGLEFAINEIASYSACNTLPTSVLLFTDGESNVGTPETIYKSLLKKLNGVSPAFTMNTFGFGYRLSSKLLFDISVLGNGINCYLPVCNFVGTTFVNCVCNFLSTVADRISIEIKPEKSGSLKCIGYEMKKNCIEVGTVHYGQTRDFIIECPKGCQLTAKLRYHTRHGNKVIEAKEMDDKLEYCKAKVRAYYLQILNEGLENYLKGSTDLTFLKKIEDIIRTSPCKSDVGIVALLKDITSPEEVEGRVSKAFSTSDRVKRWGSHYVRSIIRAHQIQQCHNFKDPGVQVYGGNLFKDLREKADKIFCSLPPPIPSRKAQAEKYQAMQANQPPPPPPVVQQADIQEYYSGGGGGCFDGEGQVKMADGSRKKVKELKKGDEVMDSKGNSAKVVCLVSFHTKKLMRVVVLNNLKLTRTHPILHEGEWKHPKDIGKVENMYMEIIYNLVLDKSHVVSINGLDVVTLGHEKKENVKLSHPFYGTEKVILYLKKHEGWGKGDVAVKGLKKVRDEITGQVISYV